MTGTVRAPLPSAFQRADYRMPNPALNDRPARAHAEPPLFDTVPACYPLDIIN